MNRICGLLLALLCTACTPTTPADTAAATQADTVLGPAPTPPPRPAEPDFPEGHAGFTHDGAPPEALAVFKRFLVWYRDEAKTRNSLWRATVTGTDIKNYYDIYVFHDEKAEVFLEYLKNEGLFSDNLLQEFRNRFAKAKEFIETKKPTEGPIDYMNADWYFCSQESPYGEMLVGMEDRVLAKPTTKPNSWEVGGWSGRQLWTVEILQQGDRFLVEGCAPYYFYKPQTD